MERSLSIEEMSKTSGGNFWDGFCVVVGVANLLTPVVSFTAVGLVILKAAAVGCLIYKGSEL